MVINTLDYPQLFKLSAFRTLVPSVIKLHGAAAGGGGCGGSGSGSAGMIVMQLTET